MLSKRTSGTAGRAKLRHFGRAFGASGPKARLFPGSSFFKWRGLNLVGTKLRDLEVDSRLGKYGGNFCAQPASGNMLFFVHCGPQNVAYLFFHTATVPPGTALQSRLNPILNVAYNKLRHERPPANLRTIS